MMIKPHIEMYHSHFCYQNYMSMLKPQLHQSNFCMQNEYNEKEKEGFFELWFSKKFIKKSQIGISRRVF
jgi:hypothetical protein